MKDKPHGNTDNKNASKPESERKGATIWARCTTLQKNLIINYAQSKGRKPQEWIIERLMNEIE